MVILNKEETELLKDYIDNTYICLILESKVNKI